MIFGQFFLEKQTYLKAYSYQKHLLLSTFTSYSKTSKNSKLLEKNTLWRLKCLLFSLKENYDVFMDLFVKNDCSNVAFCKSNKNAENEATSVKETFLTNLIMGDLKHLTFLGKFLENSSTQISSMRPSIGKTSPKNWKQHSTTSVQIKFSTC